MKRFLLSILLIAGAGASSTALAQDDPRETFNYLGVEVGVFFPQDSLLRDRFGDSIVRFGIAPVFNRNIATWKTTWELGFIGASDSGDRFTVIPLTVGLQRSFGDLSQPMVPFVRGAVGVAYIDYDIDDEDGRGFSPTGLVELGVLGGERFRASIRYTMLGEKDDINFSGLTLAVSYAVIRL